MSDNFNDFEKESNEEIQMINYEERTKIQLEKIENEKQFANYFRRELKKANLEAETRNEIIGLAGVIENIAKTASSYDLRMVKVNILNDNLTVLENSLETMNDTIVNYCFNFGTDLPQTYNLALSSGYEARKNIKQGILENFHIEG